MNKKKSVIIIISAIAIALIIALVSVAVLKSKKPTNEDITYKIYGDDNTISDNWDTDF